MIATLNDIGIKRYIEQLAGVTFDKDLHENPSLVNKAKKGKVSNVDKTKTENLDNITTHAGLPYFKQARRHLRISKTNPRFCRTGAVTGFLGSHFFQLYL